MKCIDDDIAIVGMAGLFPDAPDVRTFWDNILAKRCSITDPPNPGAKRWYDPDSRAFERLYTMRAGYLKDLARFDPLKYGVPPNLVATGDMDHFIALKVATEALEDAGLDNDRLPRERTGVIVAHGSYFNTGNTIWYQRGLALDQTLEVVRQLHPAMTDEEAGVLREHFDRSLPEMTAQNPPSLVPNIIAGRISNRLDLMGPSYIVDGACASSAIAVDHAVKDLLLDRCDVVLTGATQSCLTPQELMLFTSIGALSRQPALRPFDKDADGTLLGEGSGMLVLRRRRDAEREGDRIYALIKGVGVASDGRGRGLMAPRLEGGVLAMRRAYEQSGIDPATVELIEAHGTGIPLGDRTEIAALRATYGERAGRHATIAVGGVKSNIGHCRPAAGIAGIIKAIFALHQRILPPTINCDVPSPELELEKTPFYINTECRPWIHARAESPRRVGINALGFGGVDTHCILEEYRP